MDAFKSFFKVLFSLLLVNPAFNSVIRDDLEAGLYTPQDNVEILTVKNFNQTVFGSKKIWFIQFYSHWCGHCQRFAPIWKELAAEVKNWQDLVSLGVVDCANDINNPVCFDMLVTSYPTLRYFHQNYEHVPKNIGDKISQGDKATVKKRLINALVKDQSEGTLKININLQPYLNENISGIFQSSPEPVQYGIIIIQDTTDSIGPELTLDFRLLNEAFIIRYAFKNNTKLFNYLGPSQLPAMYAVDRDFNLLFLNSFTLDSEGFGKTILQYLSSKNIQIPSQVIEPYNQNVVIENTAVANYSDSDMLIEKIKKMGDVVLQGDLETTIRYSLRSEVGLRKEITGENLNTLRKYMDVLVKYFPSGKYTKSLLETIQVLVDAADPVYGADIATILKDTESRYSKVFSSPKQWLACKGSLPHTRGYPCGLWKLFHYLTVNAGIDKSGTNPKVVLDTMQAYVKDFFSCEGCKNHFLEMAERRKLSEVNSWDGSILWLWAAHNEVNNRLANDSTEDPAYPKVQFPLRERCEQCYTSDGMWNDAGVLEYMKKMYGRQNIQYLGSDKSLLEVDNQSSRSQRSPYISNIYLIYLGVSPYITLLVQKPAISF